MKLHFRHYYWRWLKNLTLIFLLFAFMQTVARLCFAFYFGEAETLLSDLPALRAAFFLGMRYDIMPLAYINIIPFLILHLAYFLSGRKVILTARALIISILCLGYFLLAWIYVCDYAFYSYYQDHLNILSFGLFEDDTFAVLMSVWKNYNVPLWLTLIFLVHYLCYRFFKLMFSPFEFDLKVRLLDYKVLLSFFFGVLVLAFAGRGTFNRLPLSVEDAHISNNDFINEVALNGPLTLNRAIKIRKTYGKGDFDYLSSYGFEDWKEAYAAVSGRNSGTDLVNSLMVNTPRNEFLKKNPPHVVMVVMESFGSYWNNQDDADFNLLGDLKKHFESGLLFKNFLPAENGTIGSIVSVATSQTIRPGARYLSESEFMGTRFKTSANGPFQQQGYETHFIYGGKLGWRDLGKFLGVQGYDRLWGADEIREAMPELNNFDGRDLGNEWGIFDEYLYSFIEEQLRTATKPQFFLVLTTSNHPPFEYPTTYNPLPVELTNARMSKITFDEDLARKRFLALQYANHKMGEFINRIRASSIKDKVVVGLTGDHSYWISKGVGMDEEFKRYAVPFFISAPESYIPARVNTESFGSHEDIFPTLYHMTLSDQAYLNFGDNLLENGNSAINSSGLFANKHGAYHHGEFWKWKDLKAQILERGEATPELLKLKKYSEGLIGVTDSYIKLEKKNMPTDAGNGQQ